TLIQPTIEPLYDTRTVGEILSVLADAQPQSSQQLLRTHWREQGGGSDFEKKWRDALFAGFIQGSALPKQDVQPKGSAPAAGKNARASGLEVLVRPDPTIWDGRFANNAWLQELPKPLTKLVWQNVIAL